MTKIILHFCRHKLRHFIKCTFAVATRFQINRPTHIIRDKCLLCYPYSTQTKGKFSFYKFKRVERNEIRFYKMIENCFDSFLVN